MSALTVFDGVCIASPFAFFAGHHYYREKQRANRRKLYNYSKRKCL